MSNAGKENGARIPRRRRWILWGVLLIILAALAAAAYEGYPLIKIVLGIPTTEVVSGAIDGYNRKFKFSPDGRCLAYLYRDATYVYPPALGARPLTMTDALQVKWFPIGSPVEEHATLLDAIDLRPEGEVYYNLDASVFFSPDSRRLAALCARYLVLVDLESGVLRQIHYDKEYFGSMAWQSGDEVVFTTEDDENLTFWRLNVAEADKARRQVYRETLKYEYVRSWEKPPPPLRDYYWSPDGRIVIFKRRLKETYGLLDVATGKVREFPFSLYYNCWKPDGSAVLVYVPPWDGKLTLQLIDTHTGNATDLTEEFKKALGQDLDITFVSPTWTPDGKYVILYNTKHQPPGSSGHDQSTGYVVQPEPFQIILSSDRFIRWSPIPGWVLLQGGSTFDWINYVGTRTVKINGWPNDWTWSPDQRHAAQIKNGKVAVFQPTVPSE